MSKFLNVNNFGDRQTRWANPVDNHVSQHLNANFFAWNLHKIVFANVFERNGSSGAHSFYITTQRFEQKILFRNNRFQVANSRSTFDCFCLNLMMSTNSFLALFTESSKLLIRCNSVASLCFRFCCFLLILFVCLFVCLWLPLLFLGMEVRHERQFRFMPST